jgi:cytochrome b involved in lipid metabolism
LSLPLLFSADLNAHAHGRPIAAMAEDEAKEEVVKGIKMSEVEKHSSIDDLWLVIDGT